MNNRAQFFWNKYKEEESIKNELRLKIEELEAELSYHDKLGEVYYQEFDKEVMKDND